jgi:hypothetical protein
VYSASLVKNPIGFHFQGFQATSSSRGVSQILKKIPQLLMYAALPAHIIILIMLYVLVSLLEVEVILILVTSAICKKSQQA